MSDEAKIPQPAPEEEMWPELSTYLRPLLQAFQKAPFAIAPERRDELKAMLSKLGIFAEVIPDDLSMWGEASILIRRVRLGFPLRLSYALTIHKAQGLTLDSAYVDVRAAREPGQAYVALSRVRTLAGLHLKGWFSGVFVSQAARTFYANLNGN